VTAEEAVRYICQAAGAYFRRDENGVYVISQSKPTSVVPSTTTAPGKSPKLLKRIKLLRTDARDVYDMIMFRMPFNTNRGFEAIQKFMAPNSQDAQRIFGPTANLQSQAGLRKRSDRSKAKLLRLSP